MNWIVTCSFQKRDVGLQNCVLTLRPDLFRITRSCPSPCQTSPPPKPLAEIWGADLRSLKGSTDGCRNITFIAQRGGATGSIFLRFDSAQACKRAIASIRSVIGAEILGEAATPSGGGERAQSSTIGMKRTRALPPALQASPQLAAEEEEVEEHEIEQLICQALCDPTFPAYVEKVKGSLLRIMQKLEVHGAIV